MTSSRIAVTGIGMVSALGATAAQSFERLLRGERGISDITLFDTAGQRTSIAAEVKGFRPEDVAPASPPSIWSRSDALALVAARDALDSAGVAPGQEPLGIAVGVTTAGMFEVEGFLTRVGTERGARPPENLASYPLNSTADRLAEVLGGGGPIATICSACSSGANAIIQGAHWLSLGRARRVLVGGTDALCRLTLTGFNALGATDVVPCRPFDARRGGLTLGEGAAFLVLEPEPLARRRGARIFALLSGFAVGAEAHHITQPEPSARMPAALLVRAMERAGLSKDGVDYVNAHGTGTVTNDLVETLAIRAAFGDHADRVLVSSSKGQIGHTLGASGALEAAITALAIDAERAPPTAGLEEPDAACALNHVRGQGIPAKIRAAASNSFGFGGTCAVLLFEREDTKERSRAASVSLPVVITGAAALTAAGVVRTAPPAAPREGVAGPPPAELVDRLEASRSRRFDTTTAMVTLGCEAAILAAALPASPAGLLVGTAFANVSRTAAFLQVLSARGPKRVPPAEFPHLLPSAASGSASIYLGLQGPVLATSALEAGGEAAFSIACDWVEGGMAPSFVAGSAETIDGPVADIFAPACEGQKLEPRTAGGGFLVLESLSAARARGREPLALVKGRVSCAKALLARLALDGPLSPARALLFAPRSDEAFGAVLARTGWAQAARGVLPPETGFHEALGAVALCEAAAALARHEADEALVVGESSGRAHFVHLARAT